MITVNTNSIIESHGIINKNFLPLKWISTGNDATFAGILLKDNQIIFLVQL